ncbi:superoxide dismutase [Vibrio anguillarum]|nr:superoxide dismutase [Vibrio anguillarum]
MFTVCFLSSAMRCQPLSRALCLISITNRHCFYIQ